MKGNPEKCHSKKKTSTTVTSDKPKIDIIGAKIASSLEQNFLDVIDDQLLCKSHIRKMLKRASQSLMHLQESHPTWIKRKRK